ncbi:hypothetical protein K788_0008043 [Paraburkholderia caribensis MBA4]|uniref:Uncharacterized protein n=1 Tax=Paraburkholderia caribensis MBA4 TaxID=1323664 RepID=A0A0P0R5D1_9BURK|nr:hypothetical protein K788_0008043 [Paraburkholderia caribensis MBA4]
MRRHVFLQYQLVCFAFVLQLPPARRWCDRTCRLFHRELLLVNH